MADIKVIKDKNYTTIGKYHLKEKNMSLKAIGLLSIMLSLPDNWDYSVAGLNAIRCESKNTINSLLNELEQFGYLKRERVYENGKIARWEYKLFEKPLYLKNEDIENLDIENLDIKNCTQYNTKQYNTKELNNINNKKEYKERFKPPTLEEIQNYIQENNMSVNAKEFYGFFTDGNWIDSRGNKVHNWKLKIRTWNSYNKKQDLPTWFEKDIKEESIDDTEEKELKEWLQNYE